MNEFEELVSSMRPKSPQKHILDDLIFLMQEDCMERLIAARDGLTIDKHQTADRQRIMSDLIIKIGLASEDLKKLVHVIHEQMLRGLEIQETVESYPFGRPLERYHREIQEEFHAFMEQTKEQPERHILPLQTVYAELKCSDVVDNALLWLQGEAAHKIGMGHQKMDRIRPTFQFQAPSQALHPQAAAFVHTLRVVRTTCALLTENAQYKKPAHYKARALIDKYLGFLWQVEGYLISIGTIEKEMLDKEAEQTTVRKINDTAHE